MDGPMERPERVPADPEDVEGMDAWWRRDPVEATRVWERGLSERCARSEAEGEAPPVAFRDDFGGHLYLVAADARAATWTVTVHPAPGIARVVQAEPAEEVRWYDAPPAAESLCWLVHDRHCFIRIDAPERSAPRWIRRVQPSFGRWRIRRRRTFV